MYLQKVLVFFRYTMCREFVEFLHFNKYDIIYLLQDISNNFYQQGDMLLAASKIHEFTALDLYAITERMKLPCPSTDAVRKNFDFSHVLDFCSQLENLVVRPRKGPPQPESIAKIETDVSIGTSNIVPGNLKFDLNAFRSLKSFIMYGMRTENICDAGQLRAQILQSFISFFVFSLW